MRTNVFVPLTDEILYEHPELLSNGIVPYRTGLPCLHWLKDAEVEIEYPDGHRRQVNALASASEIEAYAEHAA
jgi:hypothetical protein